MKNTFVLAVMLSFSALLPQMAFAQPVKLSAKCGDVLEGEFKNSVETQEIEITLDAGDILEMMAVPAGDELKFWVEVLDTANVPIKLEEATDLMFSDPSTRSVTINTGLVSAQGIYRIRLNNALGGKPDKTGAYNAYFKCIKQNGDILKPRY